MTLHDLAKLILVIEDNGISKVRFAKTIYFVHKELIKLNIASADDIRYIRMPLGPVPDGFMTLVDDYSDIITEVEETGLVYNSLKYKLKKKRFSKKPLQNQLYQIADKLLFDLDAVSTSELVRISHEEPSWKNHLNSQIYTISEKDLANVFPKRHKRKSLGLENQQIQASLVMGMLEDIVNESTALEYPDDAS